MDIYLTGQLGRTPNAVSPTTAPTTPDTRPSRVHGRQSRQSKHEQWWRGVHPALKNLNAMIFGFVDTSRRQNYIGAEAIAFTTEMLPIQLIKGRGTPTTRQMIQTAPQVYVQQTPIQTGIAGVAAGQIWQGVLIDNPASSPDLNPTIL